MKRKKVRSWRPVIAPIATREQFVAAIAPLPGAQARLNRIDWAEDPNYWLWELLLNLLHEAVEKSNWDLLTKVIHIYAGVSRVGERGQMYHLMTEAFEEHIRPPEDREKLRHFWRPFPRELADYLKGQWFFGGRFTSGRNHCI